MKKKVLSNRSFLVATACALGFTACSAEVDDGNLLDEGDPSEEYDNLSQALLVNDTLPTSGTKTVSIVSYPGEDNVVIMSSPSSGNWKFQINGSPIGYDGCSTGDHAVFTHWKDNSTSGGWNYWPGGGGICWPSSFWSTNLYSGSSSISYKFVIGNYTGFPNGTYAQTVYLKFTKL